MKESALCDLIAQHINKLKPGLTLLQKEQYIPNEHGTKSFIDLYAKDEKRRHVLIELKRSTTASRQAIHEVIKYVERVKQYFGAKDSEIHVIIVSTDWSELLLPFSRFYADTGFSIEGIQIDISEDNIDFQVQSIAPLPIVQGRLIAPWHNVYWYADDSAFQQGIAAIEHAYQQKGIDDYVIVKFYLPDHSTPDERRAALQAQVAGILNVSEPELFDSLSNISIPVHEYIAYTAVQMLSKDKCRLSPVIRTNWKRLMNSCPPWRKTRRCVIYTKASNPLSQLPRAIIMKLDIRPSSANSMNLQIALPLV